MQNLLRVTSQTLSFKVNLKEVIMQLKENT